MIKRVPVIPTIIVLAAVGVIVWLGIWNLERAKLHGAQLASYEAAVHMPPITFPTVLKPDSQLPFYRFATGNCLHVVKWRTSVGEDRSEEPGFVIIADCATAQGPGMSVELGWTKNPNSKVNWNGGLVSGVIVPDGVTRIRLAAATTAGGLEPTAAPSPTVPVTPARNRGYAATWFALAAIALIIYTLAVRKRLKARP